MSDDDPQKENRLRSSVGPQPFHLIASQLSSGPMALPSEASEGIAAVAQGMAEDPVIMARLRKLADQAVLARRSPPANAVASPPHDIGPASPTSDWVKDFSVPETEKASDFEEFLEVFASEPFTRIEGSPSLPQPQSPSRLKPRTSERERDDAVAQPLLMLEQEEQEASSVRAMLEKARTKHRPIPSDDATSSEIPRITTAVGSLWESILESMNLRTMQPAPGEHSSSTNSLPSPPRGPLLPPTANRAPPVPGLRGGSSDSIDEAAAELILSNKKHRVQRGCGGSESLADGRRHRRRCSKDEFHDSETAFSHSVTGVLQRHVSEEPPSAAEASSLSEHSSDAHLATEETAGTALVESYSQRAGLSADDPRLLMAAAMLINASILWALMVHHHPTRSAARAAIDGAVAAVQRAFFGW